MSGKVLNGVQIKPSSSHTLGTSINPKINEIQLGELVQKCISKNTFCACDNLSQGRSVMTMAKIASILHSEIDYTVAREKLDQFLIQYFNFKSTNQLCNWKRILVTLSKSPKPPQRISINEFLPQEMKPYAAQIAQECKKWDLNMVGEVELKKLRRIVSKKCQLDISEHDFREFCGCYVASFSPVASMINYQELFDKLGFQHRPTQRSSQGDSDSVTIHDTLELRTIERKFRAALAEKYNDFQRALLAADRFQEGYIKIDQMQALLAEIVMPEMSDRRLFKRILSVCGIKATGRVDWQRFLCKFVSNKPSGANRCGGATGHRAAQRGLTIPINSSKRVNPIHSIARMNTEQEVLETVWNYLRANFDTSRVAYLHIATNNKKGLLETHVFKRFIEEKFPTLKLNDRILRNVLLQFDPSGTGSISYEQFRELFEFSEDISAHKWLKDKHHVNDIIENRLPWNTLLDILKDQVARNLTQITDEFHLKQNSVSKRDLQKILNSNVNCLNMTDHELDKLWALFEYNKSAQECSESIKKQTISMIGFVKGLNIENHCKAINLNGVGESIILSSIQREYDRRDDQANRKQQQEVPTNLLMNKLSADQVVSLLRERMKRNNINMRKAFIKYCKSTPTIGKNLLKISSKSFLDTIRAYNINVTDKALEDEVLLKVGFTSRKEPLSYNKFVRHLEDSQLQHVRSIDQSIADMSNHVHLTNKMQAHTDPTELADLIKRKIPLKFGSCQAAFSKFAEKTLQTMFYSGFEALVSSLMLKPASDDVLRNTLDYLGLSPKGISYDQFLQVFDLHYTEEDIKPFITSVHRYNEISDHRDPKRLPSITNYYQKFIDTLNLKYSDIAKCRQVVLSSIASDKIVTKYEFQKLLQKLFNLGKSDAEFDVIWSTLCEKNEGKSSNFMHADDIFKILGRDAFSPGDTGLSDEIVKVSSDELATHLASQKAKQNQHALSQTRLTEVLHLADVVEILREKIKANFPTLRAAYDTMAACNSNYFVTIKNFQTYMKNVLNIRLSDQQMCELFELLGGDAKSMSVQEVLKHRLSYEQVLMLLDESRLDKLVDVKKIESSEHLKENGAKAKESRRKRLLEKYKRLDSVVTANMKQMILVFQKKDSEFDDVTAEEVFRVLIIYGVPHEEARKALDGFTTWTQFLEQHDLFKRKITEVSSEERPSTAHISKLPNNATATGDAPLSAGVRPATASTILSQKSLTLSELSTVKSGLTSLCSNDLLSPSKSTARKVRLQSLIVGNWSEISKSLYNACPTLGSTVTNTDIAAMAFDAFIGLFNQYVVKSHAATIEQTDILEALYDGRDNQQIIPWLVFAGVLLNRPIHKLLAANKLWTDDMANIPARSKVRLLANPRFCEAVVYLRKQLKGRSHSNSLKELLRKCRAFDPARTFSITTDQFQQILSEIVRGNLESEHMFYVILFYDRALTGNVPYLQFYNDFK